MKSRHGAALAFLLVGLLVGCKPPPPKDWSTYDVAAPTLPAGLTRIVKSDAGIQFDLRGDWVEDDGSEGARAEIQRRIAAAFGKVPDWMKSTMYTDAGFYLAILDDNEIFRKGVISEMGGTVQELASAFDFEALRRGRNFQRTSEGPKPLSMTEVELPIGRALHIVDAETVVSATGEGWVKMTKHSFFFGRDHFYWLLTFQLPEGDKRAEDEMMAIMGSVRIKKPDLMALSKAFEAQTAERKKISAERNQAAIDAENRRHEEMYQQRLEEERLRQQNQTPAEPPANQNTTGQPPESGQTSGQQNESIPPTQNENTPPPDASSGSG